VPNRIAEVTGLLAEILTPHAPLRVSVSGAGAEAFAAALAGRDGLAVGEPGDVTIFLRSSRGGAAESDADIVIDHHDPQWPVIRRVSAALADPEVWYVSESRAFFGIRAATWDTRFGDDLPAYARAVSAAGVRAGDVALDVGCGTGRALPALAAATGPAGRVIGLDLTPDMMAAARTAGRDRPAALVIADARRLPLAEACADVVFAAGLVQHLPVPGAGLGELARVTRAGGRLAIFHPSGRAALAARHGRPLRPGEPLDESRLGPLLAGAGWRLDRYEDPPDHFLALAERVVTTGPPGRAARPLGRAAHHGSQPWENLGVQSGTYGPDW
jgi:SAM-dependent methyltransferase